MLLVTHAPALVILTSSLEPSKFDDLIQCVGAKLKIMGKQNSILYLNTETHCVIGHHGAILQGLSICEKKLCSSYSETTHLLGLEVCMQRVLKFQA
jgi:hypothetical protein